MNDIRSNIVEFPEFLALELDHSIPLVEFASALAAGGFTLRNVGPKVQPIRIVRMRPARPRAIRYSRDILFPEEKRIEQWPTPAQAQARLRTLAATHFTARMSNVDIRHHERQGCTVVDCGQPL